MPASPSSPMNKFPSATSAWAQYLPAVSPSITTSRTPSAAQGDHPDTMESVADFWDNVGKPYQVAFEGLPAQLRSVEWLRNHLPSGATILDVGCGTGKPVCQMLAGDEHEASSGKTFIVQGIDISPVMIATAQAQVPSASFSLADVKTYTPPHVPIDGVVAIFSLIADVTQADIRAFFPRVASWLRPGGLFVFGTVPVPGESVPIKWMGRDVVCSGLSVEENVQRIEEAGFEVVKKEVERFTPRGEEAGLCKGEDVWEEEHLWVWGRKR